MEEPKEPRSWYKKKRYIIPIVLFVLFGFLGGDSEPSNTNSVSAPLEIPTTERKEIEKVLEPSKSKIEEVLKPVKVEVKTKETPSQPTQSCHPSYSGCLNPNASDYDCAGGSGNGPYYTGAVRVLGPDVFGLDRDNDGWGCE